MDKTTNPAGYETSNQLHVLEVIKQELTLTSISKPHIAWQLIHLFFKTLATEDPTFVHFYIARAALKDEEFGGVDRTSKEYRNIINQVALLINEHCQKIKVHLSLPQSLKKHLNDIAESPNEYSEISSSLGLIDLSSIDKTIDCSLMGKELLEIDSKFLGYLKKIGKSGKDIAKNLEPKLMKSYEIFKNDGKYPLGFWFNVSSPSEQPIFCSPALELLTRAIWFDDVSRRSNLIIKGVAAITTIVKKPIFQILSPKTKIKQGEQVIYLENETHIIGSIQRASINSTLVKNVLNGIDEMKSLTAHRLIRSYVKNTFNQAITGIKDYRVLRYDGSDKEIATGLGLKSGGEITRIKNINYALNYLEFTGPEVKSRLINIATYKSPKTNRNDGKEITVLSPLLPYRVFEDNGFLIPILTEPPYVEGRDHWAAQLFLQVIIVEEFVKQSRTLANLGCIQVTENKWKEFAQTCEISSKLLSKIQNRWLRDGPDGAPFLERVDGDFYTLGSTHKEGLEFIKEGGHMRNVQAQKGKASQDKRQKNK